MATKIRQSSLDASVITGNTALGEAAASGDFLLVYDSDIPRKFINDTFTLTL